MFPVNRVREIFTAAMSCENASARKELLKRECDGDKGLQEAVESLLFESTQTKSFLERPAVEDELVAAAASVAADIASRP